MAKVGRPTEYETDMPERAEILCRELGATDEHLAKAFGVDRATIKTWKRLYPEFLAAVKNGKDDFDSGRVEKSLLRRAVGYKYTEVTKEPSSIMVDGEVVASKEAITVKKVKREVAPDVTAQIFWLKNRQPLRWRDRKEVSINRHEEALDELE